MRRFIFFCIFSLVLLPVIGQDADSSLWNISIMLDDNLFKNFDLIKEESVNLTDSQRHVLYNTYKKSTGWYFVGNFFLGAGLGSFFQGDITGGLIGLIGELAGATTFYFGYIDRNTYYSVGSVGWSNASMTTKGVILASVGLVTLVGIRIFECIRPFRFAKSYNNKLKDSLGYSGYSMAYNISPRMNFETGASEVCFSLQFKY
ncbi:P13 family porin [Brucepastera parasyntrophica]|uniref:P13 family porin n=1 Tax=Brucepastera parasyntrophica TaxID=2880008 RepID=UPI0021089F4F|nr:P13 family porin [Brucepastera parasyntrophica]ULQ59180.1 P13 family porin [Brucepastera parasyntrophica]